MVDTGVVPRRPAPRWYWVAAIYGSFDDMPIAAMNGADIAPVLAWLNGHEDMRYARRVELRRVYGELIDMATW